LNELPYCETLDPVRGRNDREGRCLQKFLRRQFRLFDRTRSGRSTPIEQFEPFLTRQLD